MTFFFVFGLWISFVSPRLFVMPPPALSCSNRDIPWVVFKSSSLLEFDVFLGSGKATRFFFLIYSNNFYLAVWDISSLTKTVSGFFVYWGVRCVLCYFLAVYSAIFNLYVLRWRPCCVFAWVDFSCSTSFVSSMSYCLNTLRSSSFFREISYQFFRLSVSYLRRAFRFLLSVLNFSISICIFCTSSGTVVLNPCELLSSVNVTWKLAIFLFCVVINLSY